MFITVDKYKKNICLEEYFQSVETSISEVDSDVLLNYLLEGFGIKNAMDSYVTKRNILEKLLVELPPNYGLTDKFHKSLDTLLQAELRQKYLTDADFLPKIGSGPYHELSKSAIWNGDITTLKVDAIVNAANNQLLGCFIPFHGCIDNIIHCAAGPRLRKDCYTIMSLQGEVEATGLAKVTRAYNLPSRYVIHTVGPIVKGKLTELNRSDLRSSYLSCLELSKELKGIRSIAFCSISTGVYGFPFEEAAKIAIDTVNTWFSGNPNGLDYVVFNVFKDSEKLIYERLLRN
ncbi:MAG: protein-ADP-ribose hydrolase [Nitrospina sp.]|nr:protein-ADP-ribose hydrolase [Nitrospina sp.]